MFLDWNKLTNCLPCLPNACHICDKTQPCYITQSKHQNIVLILLKIYEHTCFPVGCGMFDGFSFYNQSFWWQEDTYRVIKNIAIWLRKMCCMWSMNCKFGWIIHTLINLKHRKTLTLLCFKWEWEIHVRLCQLSIAWIFSFQEIHISEKIKRLWACCIVSFKCYLGKTFSPTSGWRMHPSCEWVIAFMYLNGPVQIALLAWLMPRKEMVQILLSFKFNRSLWLRVLKGFHSFLLLSLWI